jgi:4-hydroxybenzoate polyprenyltransferase/phosphoserine phosphatase
LVVDLDGTLVRSDLLIETAFAEIGKRPLAALGLISALGKGKAALKHRLAETCAFEPAHLPYDHEVLARIRAARESGRRVYLASASNRRLVQAVAEHLGLFDGWFASDEETNLASYRKAEKLVDAFGESGFDYIGNDAADLAVWARASECIAIRASKRVRRNLSTIHAEPVHLDCDKPGLASWAKLLRVHQYPKNALVFVPLFAAHAFNATSLVQAALAFVAFCLCASAVYVLNDLVDLADDRAHRTKCNRPLASGAIPLIAGVAAIPALLIAAIAVGLLVSPAFLATLGGYFALTTAYSFFLKRTMFLDVVTLASLYTARVIAGAVAVEVHVSQWLLAFSMFFFLSLALLKRFVELTARADASLPDSQSRDYKASDMNIVAALASAAGFNAITVFALYISTDAVLQYYSRPAILWLVCPVLIYWLGRAVMLAQRRSLNDDPVVFALKDKISLSTIALAGVLVLCAI